MTISKGMAAGFVAGISIAGGAFFWLRVHEDITRERDTARIAELDAQVQRLEQTVSRLSERVMDDARIAAASRLMVLPATARTSLTAAQSSADIATEAMADDALTPGIKPQR
jgi:hypothetical protein